MVKNHQIQIQISIRSTTGPYFARTINWLCSENHQIWIQTKWEYYESQYNELIVWCKIIKFEYKLKREYCKSPNNELIVWWKIIKSEYKLKCEIMHQSQFDTLGVKLNVSLYFSFFLKKKLDVSYKIKSYFIITTLFCFNNSLPFFLNLRKKLCCYRNSFIIYKNIFHIFEKISQMQWFKKIIP